MIQTEIDKTTNTLLRLIEEDVKKDINEYVNQVDHNNWDLMNRYTEHENYTVYYKAELTTAEYPLEFDIYDIEVKDEDDNLVLTINKTWKI